MKMIDFLASIIDDPDFEEKELEILSLYLEHKDEYPQLSENTIADLARIRAIEECYIDNVKSGKQKCPDTCMDCVCINNIPDSAYEWCDEYCVCDMAPSRIAHQPNLKLFNKRPSYCPLNETDYLMDAINEFIKNN